MKTPDKKLYLEFFDVNRALNFNQFAILACVKLPSIREAVETGLLTTNGEGKIVPNGSIKNLKYLQEKLKKHIHTPTRREIDVMLLENVHLAYMAALTPKPKVKLDNYRPEKIENETFYKLYAKDPKGQPVELATFNSDKSGLEFTTLRKDLTFSIKRDKIIEVFQNGDSSLELFVSID